MILISVVVPVYNAEAYIERCVQSIIRYQSKKIELILVNDGSQDQSLRLCQKFAEHDSRIKVFDQENQGPNAARSHGVKNAIGEYVVFIDSDDWIDENALPLIEQQLSADPDLDIIHMNYIRHDEVNGTTRVEDTKFSKGIYDKKELREKIYPNMMADRTFFRFGIAPSMCSKVFRRSIVDRFIHYIPNEIFYGEDGLVTYQCLFAAQRVLLLDACMFHYNVHRGSITQGVIPKRDKLKQNNALVHCYEQLSELKEYSCQESFACYVMFLAYNGFKDRILCKLQHPELNISLADIKRTVSYDLKQYSRTAKWDKLRFMSKVLLHLVANKRVFLLYGYFRIQYRKKISL